MSKIKINAVDKLFINNLLPKTESILIQIMARDISRKVEISEKDRKTIDLKFTSEGGLKWDIKHIKKTEIEIEFSEAEISMLHEQVEKLDEAKKITASMLDTVLKIRDIKPEGKKSKK